MENRFKIQDEIQTSTFEELYIKMENRFKIRDEIQTSTFEELKINCDEWYEIGEFKQTYKYSDIDAKKDIYNILLYTSNPKIITYIISIFEKIIIKNIYAYKYVIDFFEMLTHNDYIRYLNIEPLYNFLYNNILNILSTSSGMHSISDIIYNLVQNPYILIQYQLLDLFLNMSEHFYSYDLNDTNKIFYIDYNNQLKIDRICKTQNEFENCTPFYKIIMVFKYQYAVIFYYTQAYVKYFNIENLEINRELSYALRRYKFENKNSLELLLSKNKKLNILYFIDIFANNNYISIEILDTLLSYHISNSLVLQIEKLWKLLSKVKLIGTMHSDSNTYTKIDIKYENISEIEESILESIMYNYEPELISDNYYILTRSLNNFNSKLQQLEDFLLAYV